MHAYDQGVSLAPAPGRAVLPSPGSGSPYAGVLALQQSAGNAAVARLLRAVVARCACGGTCHDCREEEEDERRHLLRQPDDGGAQGPREGEPVQLPSMTFEVPPEEATDFGQGPMLHGKTTAHFGGTAKLVPDPPKGTRTKQGCPDCGDEGCIRVQGTLVSTYACNPTMEMPDPDTLDLTDCQKKNAAKFINGTLTQHEKQHVKAFTSNFDGTTKQPFDFKVCSTDEIRPRVEGMFDTEQEARKKKAQAASDALDAGGKNQFTWDMDEGCS